MHNLISSIINIQSVKTVHAIQIIRVVDPYHKSEVNSNNPYNPGQVKNPING
jgi:hypothetical protein